MKNLSFFGSQLIEILSHICLDPFHLPIILLNDHGASDARCDRGRVYVFLYMCALVE
jgi:hypothetical protein